MFDQVEICGVGSAAIEGKQICQFLEESRPVLPLLFSHVGCRGRGWGG